MPPRTARSKSAPAAGETPTPAAAGSPAPGLFAALGVVGVHRIEPVLLGALISGDPLLLIGPHGTGKSYLLERVAAALGLEWRHYNAALLNFDDLVGYPVPGPDGRLEFIRTPAAIWGAQAVFFDEVSRCRHDIQNKMFPIIHERRVLGLPLEGLVYRWAAMNPPGGDDDALDAPLYPGAGPLDAALADRFAFIVEMPDWSALTEDEREALIRLSGAPVGPAAASGLAQAVSRGRTLLPRLLEEHRAPLARYVRLAVELLREGGIPLSGRRAAQLLRNVVAVHAARRTGSPGATLEESALLALQCSIPLPAQGVTPDPLKVVTAHREAWRLGAVPGDDPRSWVLTEKDPVRRALLAVHAGDLSRQERSALVADALAELPAGGRHALALALIESGAAGTLVASVAEETAALSAALWTPQSVSTRTYVSHRRFRVWKRVEALLSGLPGGDAERPLVTNLLCALFNADHFETPDEVDAALRSWSETRAALREAGA
ncbi:MAG: hypothetical protein KatS3mg062_0506 [Tepidiforma sp.]|nr:MAG: hypothetical protein KatS3mg062_0506 [Tepidiforma sp.]